MIIFIFISPCQCRYASLSHSVAWGMPFPSSCCTIYPNMERTNDCLCFIWQNTVNTPFPTFWFPGACKRHQCKCVPFKSSEWQGIEWLLYYSSLFFIFVGLLWLQLLPLLVSHKDRFSQKMLFVALYYVAPIPKDWVLSIVRNDFASNLASKFGSL